VLTNGSGAADADLLPRPPAPKPMFAFALSAPSATTR
jgi:hypothetical protein